MKILLKFIVVFLIGFGAGSLIGKKSDELDWDNLPMSIDVAPIAPVEKQPASTVTPMEQGVVQSPLLSKLGSLKRSSRLTDFLLKLNAHDTREGRLESRRGDENPFLASDRLAALREKMDLRRDGRPAQPLTDHEPPPALRSHSPNSAHAHTTRKPRPATAPAPPDTTPTPTTPVARPASTQAFPSFDLDSVHSFDETRPEKEEKRIAQNPFLPPKRAVGTSVNTPPATIRTTPPSAATTTLLAGLTADFDGEPSQAEPETTAETEPTSEPETTGEPVSTAEPTKENDKKNAAYQTWTSATVVMLSLILSY